MIDRITPLLLLILLSCNGQNKTNLPQDSTVESYTISNDITPQENQLTPQRISEFVRRIFQDKSGNLWFGTNGDGVIRYNGDSLEYFSVYEGFGGFAVRGIVEDKEGNVWFGTSGGVTKYDGESFTNFTDQWRSVHSVYHP